MMARRWKFWGRSIFRRSGKFGMTRRMKSQNQKWRRTRVFYLLTAFQTVSHLLVGVDVQTLNFQVHPQDNLLEQDLERAMASQ